MSEHRFTAFRLRAAMPTVWRQMDRQLPVELTSRVEEVSLPHPYNPEFGTLRQLQADDWVFVSLAMLDAAEWLDEQLALPTYTEAERVTFDLRRRKCLRLARVLNPELFTGHAILRPPRRTLLT